MKGLRLHFFCFLHSASVGLGWSRHVAVTVDGFFWSPEACSTFFTLILLSFSNVDLVCLILWNFGYLPINLKICSCRRGFIITFEVWFRIKHLDSLVNVLPYQIIILNHIHFPDNFKYYHVFYSQCSEKHFGSVRPRFHNTSCWKAVKYLRHKLWELLELCLLLYTTKELMNWN